MDDINISIIIPVYNIEQWIGLMIDSLKEQDLGNYKAEIIFVINNCTDNSEGVIRDSGLDCRILYCQRQGCGNARNVGLEACSGEYIWFMDGDDWLLSDTAIKQVLDKAYELDLNALLIPFNSNLFRRPYYSMVWQYLLRRSFVQDIRFPSIQPQEDDVYTALVLKRLGYTATSYLMMPRVDNALYFYNYMREGSNMFRVFHGEQLPQT